MAANLSENYLSQVLLLLIVAILCWLWMNNYKRWRKGKPLPPGPRGLPVVGYLPFIGKNLHHEFTKLAEKYGPIYKLWLGRKLCIVISSPSLAKQVCRDLDVVFSNRDPTIAALILTYNGVDIPWSPLGPYWRNMRKLFVREMLSNSNIDACYHLRRQEVRKTIKHLYEKCGLPVEIGTIAFLTEFNATISMLWGGSSSSTFEGGNDDGAGAGAEFHALTTKFLKLLEFPNISDFFPILARFDLQGVKRQANEILAEVDMFMNTIIDAREKEKAKNGDGNDGRKDFLQILLDLRDSNDTTDTPITQTQIKALLLDILVGGTDTSATAVEWAMTEILHHPEVMKRVQEEISKVVGNENLVEETHLPKLRYLDATVKETFRLHPPIPLNVPRCPSETCIVGGYSIPKGSKILLNISAIHRDPKIWETPLEFRPERFLDGGDEEGISKWDYSGNNFEFFPFGSGRRVCAGIPLAEKMVLYILASLLHSFDWHLPKGAEEMDFSEDFGIVVRKRMPLVAVPMPRLSDDLL